MNLNGVFSVLVLTCSFLINEVFTLNILGIFPYQGKTHFDVFKPYLEELARRGHNLTVISHFPQTTTKENYEDISLADTTQHFQDLFPLELSYRTIIDVSFFLVDGGNDNCEKLLAHKEVQKLWKSHKKFDVVVTEQFNSDCSLGLAYKLRAPVVGINSHFLLPWHYSRFGIQYNPSYVPFLFLEGGTRPSLYQRVERTLFHAYFTLLYKYRSQRHNQNVLAQYFDDIPPLEELAREIKFMLLYQNFVLSGTNMLPSNLVEVGGYHVAKPKQLPNDIRQFIEGSEHGVIYISFGSMVKATTIPKDKLYAILGAISELPQRVIWKWSNETLPGNPKNVLLSKWLPQNDILGHPKVLAFYSHCGLLSTTEAIHHGVPVVGMPVLGDQPANAAAIEQSGLGVQIQIYELTKENLLNKLKTVLDPGFRRNVKLLSKAWHERAVSPMDSAIYWTEFAARHSNFTFRSRAADVPFYQYLYLDIILVLSSILITCIIIIKHLFTLFAKGKYQNIKQKTK